MEMMDRLAEAEKRLGYRFVDRSRLAQALCHASASDDRLDSNERLEFLGDAVLGMVVCRELYVRFPDLLEGELTKIKSNVVSRRVCAEIADDLGLGDLLLIGKGMDGRGEMPPSLLAAVLESVIGAMYEDAGMERTANFILELLESRIDHAAKLGHQQNFKSVLQQVFQRKGLGSPNYVVLDERGPDHAKCFEVAVATSLHRFEGCWGPNKKQAEQQAALAALLDLSLAGTDDAGDVVLDDACWTDEPIPYETLQSASHDRPMPDAAAAGEAAGDADATSEANAEADADETPTDSVPVGTDEVDDDLSG